MDWLKSLLKRPKTSDFPDHSTIARVNPYDSSLLHKRQSYLLRLSIMLNVLMTLAFVLTVSAMTTLLPLKEVRPALLRIDPADNRIYRVEPISQDVDGFEIFLEKTAMRFVQSLLEIDAATQERRLTEAFTLMEDSFYREWHSQNVENEKIQKALDRGLTREIEIQTANLQQSFVGTPEGDIWIYAVNYLQRDFSFGEFYSEKPLTAYLKLAIRPQDITQKELYDNPLGVRVLSMSIKKPRIVEDEAQQDYLK